MLDTFSWKYIFFEMIPESTLFFFQDDSWMYIKWLISALEYLVRSVETSQKGEMSHQGASIYYNLQNKEPLNPKW